jgi:cysteine synthase A
MPIETSASALDLIGNTSLVRLGRISEAEAADIYAKVEFLSPGGSVKDRIALAMIEAAESDGRIKPGGTVIEPSGGNTGIGLAVVCALKGYRLVLTMPESISPERRRLFGGYGAELVLTANRQGMRGSVQKAEELAAANGWLLPQQFRNPANPDTHRRTTGPEIIKAMQGLTIDGFAAGVGTGGTITGAGEALRAHNPAIRIAAVEPADSPVLSGGLPGPHEIQGIGAGFVPDVLNTAIYDEVIPVTSEQTFACVRRLAREEGLLCGISSGAVVAGALQLARRLGAGKNVVVILPDSGERYLSMGLFD